VPAGWLMGVGAMSSLAGALWMPALSIVYQTLLPLCHVLFSVGAVAVAARGARGWWARALEWRFLQFTGRISYGLYLYHLFCGYVLSMICDRLHVAKPTSDWVLVPMFVTMTYTAAWLSWHLIERPVNDLKRFFPHNPRAHAQRSAPPDAVSI
jgi:peptidoglycan/LPS O-acetylase OafA/YrhL